MARHLKPTEDGPALWELLTGDDGSKDEWLYELDRNVLVENNFFNVFIGIMQTTRLMNAAPNSAVARDYKEKRDSFTRVITWLCKYYEHVSE